MVGEAVARLDCELCTTVPRTIAGFKALLAYGSNENKATTLLQSSLTTTITYRAARCFWKPCTRQPNN
jgi:hypothetical protein